MWDCAQKKALEKSFKLVTNKSCPEWTKGAKICYSLWFFLNSDSTLGDALDDTLGNTLGDLAGIAGLIVDFVTVAFMYGVWVHFGGIVNEIVFNFSLFLATL